MNDDKHLSDIEAPSFIKTGGLASQYLKADGSVDFGQRVVEIVDTTRNFQSDDRFKTLVAQGNPKLNLFGNIFQVNDEIEIFGRSRITIVDLDNYIAIDYLGVIYDINNPDISIPINSKAWLKCIDLGVFVLIITLANTSGGGSSTWGAITGTLSSQTDLQNALNAKVDKLITTNRQTASYTLALTDANKLVEMNVATANNLTVPPNASVAFPIGTPIEISQYGAGVTTIVAGAGVTIRSANNWYKMNAQYAGASLVKIGTNEWYLFGNLNA